MARIHPTAVIDSSAHIGQTTHIGPYCVIGANVTLGEGCTLHNHVTIAGPTTIGEGNEFYPYSSIGQRSQDLKYEAEPTYLEIGDRNTFREFVTIHRATAPNGARNVFREYVSIHLGTQEGEWTVLGDDNTLLAYAHIAHDCVVGDDVLFSNNGTLAGHVVVGDHAVISGLSGVHQFCRIGAHAIVGGCTKIVQDVPPFMIADGNPAEIRGVNLVGLERRGFAPEAIRELREAYKLVYRSNLNTTQGLEALRAQFASSELVTHLAEFIATSERGIVR
jgi:UDP-N-acetylglucosamine acyltransferase